MCRKLLCFIAAAFSVYFASAQTFSPDKNGYVADPKFHQLIKSRGYELVTTFDTVQVNPLLIIARFQKKGMWGVIDNHGKVIEEAKSTSDITSKPVKGDTYENIYPTPSYKKRPYGAFVTNGKWGAKDALGNETVHPIYDLLSFYDDSIATTRSGRLYGAVTGSGKVLFEPMYESVNYSGGQGKFFIVKKDGHYGVISVAGKELIPLQYDRIANDYISKNALKVTSGNKQALYNAKGVALTGFTYNQIGNFMPGGVAIFKTGESPDIKTGLLDTLGIVRVSAEYTTIEQTGAKTVFKAATGKYPDQQYCLIDASGKVVSAKDYADMGYFSKGVSRVSRGKYPDKKYGLVDTTGREAVPTKYEVLGDVGKNGQVIVANNKKYGLVDLKGQEVVPLQYDGLVPNSSKPRYVIILNHKYGLIDAQGKVLLQPQYDGMLPAGLLGYFIFQNKKKGFADEDGKLLVAPKYDNISQVTKGILDAELDGRKGRLDFYGNELFEKGEGEVNFVPDEYGYVNTPGFQQYIRQKGLQLVGKFDTLQKDPLKFAARVILNGSWKLMDVHGRMTPYEDRMGGFTANSPLDRRSSLVYGNRDITIDEPVGNSDVRIDAVIISEPEKGKPFFEMVAMNGKYGTQDKANNKVGLPAIYDGITFMGGNEWAMIKMGDKYGMAHANGKVDLPPNYEQITPDVKRGKFDFDRFFVKVGGKYGIITGTGQEIVAPKYDLLMNVESFDYSNNLMRFTVDKKCGLMTKTGKILAEPDYDDMISLRPGLIRVSKGTTYAARRYGLIDTAGKLILPVEYKRIELGYNNKWIRLVGGEGREKFGFMDYNGKILIKPIYDEIRDFKDGLAAVRLNGKYGLMNESEKFIIPAEYDELYTFWHYQLVEVQKGLKKGFLDMKGNIVVPMEYDEIDRGKDGYLFKKDNKWGMMNTKLKVLQTFNYDEVKSVSNCYAVSLQLKWGLMSADGKLITPIKYDRIDGGSNAMARGFADVKLDGKWLIVDHYGNEYALKDR